ncbi:hypothetical protein ACFL03_13425 [Thermodesulfobacteriota bacterium]
MIKRLIKRFSWKKTADNRVQIKKTGSAKRLETYTIAAAFAEAGLQDAARELLQERPKILVVGEADQFSDPLIDYAIGLAKRMTYEIIALNCASIDFGTSKKSEPYQKEMFKNFQASAANGARVFAARAAEEGIPFQHVVKSGNVESCVRKLERKTSRLQFVLKDLASPMEVVRDTSIPVFFISK